MATDPRYEGKPLLRLLELYVLKAIGELSQESEDALNAMGSKLQAHLWRRRTMGRRCRQGSSHA